MKKEMLINVLQPEECRIAILENGVLEELYVERTSRESYVGNIYKGRIVNIEPSIQAAFVDFGVGRNGFLHVSDVEPTYYRHLEQRGDRRGRDRGRGDNDFDRDRGRGDRDHDRSRGQRRPPHAPPSPPSPVVDEDIAFTSLPAPDPTVVVQTSVMDVSATEAFVSENKPVEISPPVVPTVEMNLPFDDLSPATPPLVADPDTAELGEDSGKGRRRSRSSGPRRKRGPDESRDDDSAAPKANGGEPESDDPPITFMPSAEHRTTKDSGDAKDSGDISDDDLLFFPARPAASTREPEPTPIEMEPEPVAPPPAPVYEPIRVSRPRPSSRGRIEDELEADLAAAEVDEAASTAPDLAGSITETVREEESVEMERAEPVEEPARPESDDELSRDFEDTLDDTFERDFGDAGGPEEMEERFEHRGRGGRDNQHGRGRRDDRGGGGRRRMGGRPGMGRPKPLIQDIFKRGQEVIVQVIKEGLGTKGPTLSTYISIPGRYLVLMPGLNRTGVSRKIQDEDLRRKLRDTFNELNPPKGVGFIIRTATVNLNKKELQRDLAYLSRLWQVIARRIKKLKSPCEIYEESDIVTRTIRDSFGGDIDSITIDEPTQFEHAKEFMEIVMPRYAGRLKLYDGKDPLFHRFGIEDEIHKIQQKKVPLPAGGSIVIEQTEALVAIDVNSGTFRANRMDAEETAYQMNLQAAKEIARQLRLRDLTGIIVNDFIDMRDEKHRRAVEKALRDAVKRDRARTKILKTSAFGVIEMTRQRTRDSLKKSTYKECPFCHGMSHVKTCESMSLEVMRLIQLAAFREHVKRIDVRVSWDVSDYLQNHKRREIAKLEEGDALAVNIAGAHGVPPEQLEFVCFDNNGNEVKVLPPQEPVGRRR